VPRDPVVDALVAEIDQALAALQTARRLLADLQRSGRAVRVARRPGPPEAEASIPTSIRYSGMTVAEAADTLRVSEEHVRRMLRSGQLVGVGFGGRVGWRLSREHVLQMASDLIEQGRGQDVARLRKRPGAPRGGARRRPSAR
jgi:excisionase family DNA binding protein